MNYFQLSQTAFTLILFCFSQTISSQATEWHYTADETSGGNSATLTSDNSILQARRHTNNVAKFDVDGNLIWEKNVCNCTQGIEYSKELPSGDLVHLTSNGFIYSSNGEGDNPFIIGHVLSDSFDIDSSYFFQFEKIHETTDGLHILASFSNNNQRGSSSTSFNFITLEISKKISPLEPPYTINRYQNLNTGNTVELVLSVNTYGERLHWYNVYDETGNFLFLSNIDSLDLTLSNILINDEQEVFVIGRQTSELRNQEAVIRKYGAEGDLKFEKTLRSENETSFGLAFTAATLHQNKLILAGIYGITLAITNNYELHVIEINTDNGTTNWSLRNNEKIDQHLPNSIVVSPDEKVIVAGTCCLSEFFGPERAFLLEINPSITNTAQLVVSDISLFPNPVSNQLNISDPSDELISINVLDKHSRLIYSQKDSKSIDLSGYSNGSYLLRIKTNGGTLTKKIVKI